jgi:hypothetical protein
VKIVINRNRAVLHVDIQPECRITPGIRVANYTPFDVSVNMIPAHTSSIPKAQHNPQVHARFEMISLQQ